MRVSHKFCWSTWWAWPFSGGGSELLYCPAHPRLLLQSQVAPSHLPPSLSCGLGHTFPGKDGAGNGLFVPQFMLGASHPLLRSEQGLGRRAAGSWLSFALEWDGRAAFKSHCPSCCRQEAAHVLHRGATGKMGMCSQKTKRETPQTAACEHPGNPGIQKTLECFLIHVSHPGCDFWLWNPKQEQANPKTPPEKSNIIKCTSGLLRLWQSPQAERRNRAHFRSSQGRLGTNFHLYELFWAETSQKVCEQSPFFSACI